MREVLPWIAGALVLLAALVKAFGLAIDCLADIEAMEDDR